MLGFLGCKHKVGRMGSGQDPGSINAKLLQLFAAIIIFLIGIWVAGSHHWPALKWLWEQTGMTDVAAVALIVGGIIWGCLLWRRNALLQPGPEVTVFQMLEALRDQIVNAQEKLRTEGKPGVLFLDAAEVEAKFTLEIEGDAEVKLHAVKLGSKVTGANEHSIKCTVKLTGDPKAQVAEGAQGDKPKEGTAEEKDLKEGLE
jgi:hypothetical protein